MLFVGHTAKSHFAMCNDENALQKKHTAKSMLCHVLAHGKDFAVCFFFHTVKAIVYRVLFSAHGKVIIFFTSHLETFSTLHTHIM